MPKQIVASKSLATSSANNIATAQQLNAAGSFTLNGSTVSNVLQPPTAFLPGVQTQSIPVAQLDSQRRIGISSNGDDLGITFTITGTNQAGQAISETVAGTNGSVATTLQDFYTVTGASASGATASTVTIGTTTTGSTPWFMLDEWLTPTLVQVTTQLVSGSATWSIETTDNDPRAPFAQLIEYNTTPPIPTPVGLLGMTNLSGNTSGSIAAPVQAWRLTVTVGQGLVRALVQQAGLAQ